ncbi:MAG: hypothetical protein Tsb0020_21190 [Haliangiales bacterium]
MAREVSLECSGVALEYSGLAQIDCSIAAELENFRREIAKYSEITSRALLGASVRKHACSLIIPTHAIEYDTAQHLNAPTCTP